MSAISVFLASDDNYAPYLCTTAYSLLENTKSYVNFYILDNKISQDFKAKIQSSLKCFGNFSLEYINISNIGLERFPNLKHYSLNTFSRYFIPELKPELNKALYFDVDIIFKGDVAALYNEEFESKALIAVSEKHFGCNGNYLKDNIYPEYKDTQNYFNAGVLVLNLEKIKQNNSMQTCIDKTIELYDKLSCPDQDVLNIVFENDVKYVSEKYNYMPDMHEHYYSKFFGEDAAKKLKNNAVIVHYVSGKPWFGLSVASDIFFDTAKKTEFAKIIDRNLNKFIINQLKKTGSFFEKYIFSVQKQRFDNKRRTIYVLFGGFVTKGKWKKYHF